MSNMFIVACWSCTENCGYDKEANIRIADDNLTEKVKAQYINRLIKSFADSKASRDHWAKGHPVRMTVRIEAGK